MPSQKQFEILDEPEFVNWLPEKYILTKISSVPEFEFIKKAPGYILYKYNEKIK